MATQTVTQQPDNRPQRSKTTTSRSARATSKAGSTVTRTVLAALRPYLPAGWSVFFALHHAGNRPGLSVECPFCKDAPPPACNYGYRRWRWLSVHMAQHEKKTV